MLLSTVIQPLLNIWIVFHRSRYSLDFINFSDNDTKSSQIKEKKILPFDKITKIELINLSMSYKEKNIFSNLNFNFKSGEIYVISGVNGSGKSTLLKILEGFKSPVNGKIVINDVSYDTLEDTNIVEYIGIYSTEFRLFSGSVDRNIKFDLFSKDFKVDLGQNSFLNLSNNYQINSQGKNLSQGQQQKILILRALENHKKDIYFLDEPTSNLDESSKQILLEKLKELRSKNKIICIITHDEYIKKIASEILYLGE